MIKMYDKIISWKGNMIKMLTACNLNTTSVEILSIDTALFAGREGKSLRYRE